VSALGLDVLRASVSTFPGCVHALVALMMPGSGEAGGQAMRARLEQQLRTRLAPGEQLVVQLLGGGHQSEQELAAHARGAYLQPVALALPAEAATLTLVMPPVLLARLAAAGRRLRVVVLPEGGVVPLFDGCWGTEEVSGSDRRTAPCWPCCCPAQAQPALSAGRHTRSARSTLCTPHIAASGGLARRGVHPPLGCLACCSRQPRAGCQPSFAPPSFASQVPANGRLHLTIPTAALQPPLMLQAVLLSVPAAGAAAAGLQEQAFMQLVLLALPPEACASMLHVFASMAAQVGSPAAAYAQSYAVMARDVNMLLQIPAATYGAAAPALARVRACVLACLHSHGPAAAAAAQLLQPSAATPPPAAPLPPPAAPDAAPVKHAATCSVDKSASKAGAAAAAAGSSGGAADDTKPGKAALSQQQAGAGSLGAAALQLPRRVGPLAVLRGFPDPGTERAYRLYKTKQLEFVDGGFAALKVGPGQVQARRDGAHPTATYPTACCGGKRARLCPQTPPHHLCCRSPPCCACRC
jgi:hypothetical protein